MLSVTNPTTFDRERWVVFGSDHTGSTMRPVVCREMRDNVIEAALIKAPAGFRGSIPSLNDLRDNEPFLSVPVATSMGTEFVPTITVDSRDFDFRLHDQVWEGKLPGSEEPAITKFEWRADGPDWHARLWTVLGRGDVVMPFELWFAHDLKTERTDQITVDMGVRGFGVNRRIWTRPDETKPLYVGPLLDRQSMSFQGAFLFYAGATQEQLQTLMAEWAGPLPVASLRTNYGVWNKAIPEISKQAWRARHSDKMEALRKVMENPLAYLGFIGSLRPADTGAQGGFGSWQGIYTHAAHWGDDHQQSQDVFLDGIIAHQEARRPIFFFESTGEIVRASMHKKYVSWVQGPHFNKVVSPDRLYRDDQKWYLLQGEWVPNDEEHDVSALWPAHDVRINDSEVSRITLDMASEHLIARHTMPSTHPGWSTNGFGAGRAVGRTLLNVAEIYLTVGNLKLLEHIEKKWFEVIEPMYVDPLPEVPVYRVIEKDDRVFDGKKPGWVVWEDAIFVMGTDAFRVALKAAGKTESAKKVERITNMITKSIVDYGFMPNANDPMILKLISWELGGKAIPNEWYDDKKKIYVEDSSNTDFTTWAKPALEIAARWNGNTGDRARKLLSNMNASMDLYRIAKYSGLV